MITTDDIKNIIPQIIEDATVEEMVEMLEVFTEGIELIDAELIHRNLNETITE